MPRAFTLAKIYEKKCNICSEWCQSMIFIKDSLFGCNLCLQKYRKNGLEMIGENGQHYKVFLVKEEQSMPNSQIKIRQNIQEHISQDVQNAFMKWSRVKSLIDQNQYTDQEIQAIQCQIGEINKDSEYETQNLLGFMRSLSHTKSKYNLQDYCQEEQKSIYNSCVFNENEKSISKFDNLEDMSDMNSSRFVRNYQYYFDVSDIKKFKESVLKTNQVRQFGTEISPLNFQNIHQKDSHINKSSRKLKFNKSALSLKSIDKNIKLSEDELKNRIFSYMEGKYQSITLNRIMATYVKQAYMRTNLDSKTLELTMFKISQMDLQCYLSLFDFDNISTIKLVNVGLTDSQLQIVIDSISNKKVETLVLTGNKLTQLSLLKLLNKSLPFLREIYLGKNRINKYRMKENIVELRSKFILYL